MSPKKLCFTVAMAATLAFGGCAWKETLTETVSTETRIVDGGTVLSSADAIGNTGASGGMGGTGSVSNTRTRTMERNGFGDEWHVVR